MSSSLALASRVRAARTDRGFTLEDLADRTGISKSHISRIESGNRQPSLMALMRIAVALDTTASTLLGTIEDGAAIVFGPGTDATVNDGITVTPLGQMKGGLLESFHVLVPPAPRTRALTTHDGEECLYVLSGMLKLVVGDEEHFVVAGNVAHFDAHVPHCLLPTDDRPVRVLMVSTARNGNPPHAELYDSHPG